jgi:hypothetical protein
VKPTESLPPVESAAAVARARFNVGPAPHRWSGTWLDGVAFALGLALAWWLRWQTTDLVWSLWLSSLVVGYATIVWGLSEPVRDAVDGFRGDTEHVASTGAKALVLGGIVLVMLLVLAFFTVHFGMFHAIHSIFLNLFFPVTPERTGALLNWGLYAEVVRRYWWFVPVAALAERQAFGRRTTPGDADDAVSLSRHLGDKDRMAAPYRNVIRMHMLIFFFAFAHFARLENFAVYAVVYLVYFFPWRVFKRQSAV